MHMDFSVDALSTGFACGLFFLIIGNRCFLSA